MSNGLTTASALQGDALLRHQRARIAQRHLQFGRHCRLDIGCLLRAVHRVRVAPLAEVAVERQEVDAPTPNCYRARGPATLGDFVPSSRADVFPYREWVATLADRTTVVVSDWCAAPSPLGIEKAVSIVQSRAYLEHRARRLLPFAKAERWRLASIDFGTKARGHGCEFLMRFAGPNTSAFPSITSPSVEIGFALPSPTAMDPVFVLTVVAASDSLLDGLFHFPRQETIAVIAAPRAELA
jgi:hypothetical protein